MEEQAIIGEFQLPLVRMIYWKVRGDDKIRSRHFLGGVVLDKSDEKKVVLKHEDAPSAFAAYKEPHLPVDLNAGFDLDQDPYGDDELWEPKTKILMDGLKVLGLEKIVVNGSELEKIEMYHDREFPRFLTFRNNLIKIMQTAYDRRGPWKIRVIRDETNLIKLEVVGMDLDYAEPEQIKQFVYWGRRFEDYCFVKPAKKEYIAIQVTVLGDHTLIVGAEIDGYDATIKTPKGTPQARWVELKTKRDPALHFKTQRNFNKWALMKSWIQAHISGCPTIIYGFRNEKGKVERMKTYKTKNIPRRKGVSWKPRAILWLVNKFLSFLVKNTEAGKKYLAEYAGGEKISLMVIG